MEGEVRGEESTLQCSAPPIPGPAVCVCVCVCVCVRVLGRTLLW